MNLRVIRLYPEHFRFGTSRISESDRLRTEVPSPGLCLRQPRRAASIVAMSIFFIGIIASKARFASAPPAASACQRFCDCIYKQGNPLNACLREYHRAKEAGAKPRPPVR